MSTKGRRYEGEPKLNLKKVFAVIIAIAVIIMFIIGIKKLMTPNSNADEKVVALEYVPVYTNDKWGVINSKGDIIVEPTYDETIIIPDNESPVFICTYDVDYTKGTYKTKVINEKNETILEDYELVEAIENYDDNNNLWYEKNVLKVKKDGKYGLIDLKGNQLAQCDYDDITALKGTTNSLITTKNQLKGIIDNTGAVIIDNKYKNIIAISDKYENGYIVQDEGGKYGVVNWNKTIALETKYDEIKPIYGNGTYYVVKEDGKWKVVDTEENEYLVGKFDNIKSINNEYAIIEKGGKYGVKNIEDGSDVIETKYQDLIYATSTNYIYKLNSKYGIINDQQKILLEGKYKNIVYRNTANFYEAVKEDYTSDLIDSDINVKLNGIVSKINIDDGYMVIKQGEEYKYYNFKFEEKESKDVLKNNTIFLSKKDGKYGFVNSDGIVVVDYIYDDASEQNQYGYASVKKDGLWGCVDSTGKVNLEPSYKLENNTMIEFIGKWHLGEDLNLNYFTDK